MTSNLLSKALTEYGDCTEADGVFKANGGGLSLYVSLGETMLTVDKIRWVKLDEDAVVIQTRSNCFVFAHEDVRGISTQKSGTGVGYSG